MEPQILLAQLRAHLERMPDFSTYSPHSREQMTWLGQANALVSRWNKSEEMSFKSACNFMSSELMRGSSLNAIIGTLHRAIADLELSVPTDIQVSFGAGEVYDFFSALNKVIASAEKSVFIIDPYLDQTVFEHYLHSRRPAVQVRLLSSHKTHEIVPAASKYTEQHGQVLQIRQSKNLHDRVIFVDEGVCWLIGQSLKDAAKAKPTYLVPLPPDVVPNKLSHYEEIWQSGSLL